MTPAQFREALLLPFPGLRAFALSQIFAPDHSDDLEDTARVRGPVGTIKSRVSRARASLAAALGRDSICELGPDNMTRAALQPICLQRRLHHSPTTCGGGTTEPFGFHSSRQVGP